MAKIEAIIMISRPISDVFVYVTDAESWMQWESGLLEVEQTSEGPMDVGTTFRGTNKVMGRRMDWTSEVTEYESSRKWGQKIVSSSMSIVESLTFEPVEGGTRITLFSQFETSGFFRLVDPIMTYIGRKQIESNLDNLKSILEAQT